MKALARYYGAKLLIFDSNAFLGVRTNYSLCSCVLSGCGCGWTIEILRVNFWTLLFSWSDANHEYISISFRGYL